MTEQEFPQTVHKMISNIYGDDVGIGGVMNNAKD